MVLLGQLHHNKLKTEKIGEMKKIFIISLFIAVIPAFVLAEVPETQMLAQAEKKVDALFNNLRSVSNKNTSSL